MKKNDEKYFFSPLVLVDPLFQAGQVNRLYPTRDQAETFGISRLIKKNSSCKKYTCDDFAAKCDQTVVVVSSIVGSNVAILSYRNSCGKL